MRGVRARHFTPADNTHTSPAGARLNAACVVEGLRANVVYCPVEMEPPDATPPWPAGDGPIVGFVGRIEQRKGPLELARAKNYVALRYPSSFETTGDISRRLEDQLVFHLPDDYFSKYVQNIQAVTAADVQRVAQKYIAPGRFAVVVVGDRQTIEQGIRALNLGVIKVMSVDDVFGPKP